MKTIKPPSMEDRKKSPATVQAYMSKLEEILISQQTRLDKLEAAMDKLLSNNHKNSNNSSNPPSSNPPYSGKQKAKDSDPKTKRKKGAQPGHEGHHQVLLDPTETHVILPS